MGKTGISVEILLYALCNTLSEIAKVDERVKKIIKNWDLEIQFNVQPDGPSAYLQIEKGRIIYYKGETSHPDLKIIFSSAERAYGFFTSKGVVTTLQ